MTPVLFIVVLLAPSAFASTTPSCLNVTLPGILNLGQCFGTSLSLCSTSLSGIIAALTKLVTCLATALTTTSIAGAATALFQIISLVLNLSGLGFLLSLVNLTPLCAITNTPGCLTLLNGNATCTTPISITLPDTANISRCVNQTLLLCQNGALATDRLLMNLINTLTCLLTTLLTSNPGSLLNGLACALAGLIPALPGLSFFGTTIKLLFRCP
ncbi:uncharacterized protein LOC144101658 [Amblyomma americanum]|uniref:Secreted protein n=1 Tax=Amblyomma americanum TaxID=6943 RepID=A0AAQ4EJ14_AMBAM